MAKTKLAQTLKRNDTVLNTGQENEWYYRLTVLTAKQEDYDDGWSKFPAVKVVLQSKRPDGQTFEHNVVYRLDEEVAVA
jgi:hypothetical protein